MFIATLRLKTDEFSNERGGRFFPIESRQHPDQQWGPPLSVQKEACRCRLLTCSPLLHSTGWLRQPESSRTGPGPETHAPWHHRVPDTLPPWVQLSPLQGFHPLLWGLSAAARARQGGSVTVNCWARLPDTRGRESVLSHASIIGGGGEGSRRFLARPLQGVREQPFLTLQGQIYNNSWLIKSRPLNQHIHYAFSLPEPRVPSSRPDLMFY